MNHVNGIDVSAYQGKIDWARVKESGYSFAYAKATEGVSFVDETFAYNQENAVKAGVYFGAYHFFSWNLDPSAQAGHFLRTYAPQHGHLPPMLDIEGVIPPETEALSRITVFVQDVEKELDGQRLVLYANWNVVTSVLPRLRQYFAGHPLWLAAYNSDPEPPNVGWNVQLWQYADNLEVGGISGPVDGDRFIGTLEDLKAFSLSLT